jgi:pimeloyl-ACP methyl ester carboxylesterase
MFTQQIKKLFCLTFLVLCGCRTVATAIPTFFSSTPEPIVTAAKLVTPTAMTIPTFEEAECTFEIPEGFKPHCGYLVVPEDRSQLGGRTIRLHVAIFESTNPNSMPDPVIHLAGGPGASALNNVRYILMKGGKEIMEQRDYILFDQRGTELSDPFLYCLPYDEYLWDAHEQNLSLAEYNAGALPILDACLKDWQSLGINLAAYNSVENAADVDDLRSVLGYEKVNLYGTSYGTRLALNVMRDYPEGIRSVIIDSVFPPQANLDLEIAASAFRSLQKVFQACAEDEYCAGEYGDIEAKFYAVIEKLEATPVQLEVYGPYRDNPYMVYLDGDLFIDTIFVGLYSMISIADIPYFIQAAYVEAYPKLSEPVGGAIGSPLSTGLFWSTTCGEEIPFEIGAPETVESAAVPVVLREHFSARYAIDVCSLWNVPTAAAIENQAVSSDIPTLVLSGSYDPVTPPHEAQLAAETLSQHYYYEFSNQTHGVMRSTPCALQMGLAFLADPLHAPDSSCMNEPESLEFH